MKKKKQVLTDFQIATGTLYATFSKYQASQNLFNSVCSISEETAHKIMSKPLRYLTPEDFGNYPMKAMTTCGTVKDFKHFLPRILELLAKEGQWADQEIILSKLSYGDWRDWPEKEIMVIEQFLIEWWRKVLRENTCFDQQLFVSLVNIFKDTEKLLLLAPKFENSIFLAQFSHLVKFYLQELYIEGPLSLDWGCVDTRYFIKWICAHAKPLEDELNSSKENPDQLHLDATESLNLIREVLIDRKIEIIDFIGSVLGIGDQVKLEYLSLQKPILLGKIVEIDLKNEVIRIEPMNQVFSQNRRAESIEMMGLWDCTSPPTTRT